MTEKPRRPGRITRERVPVPETSSAGSFKEPASAVRKKELADAERERWLARIGEAKKG
jgi:hypothetical protein